MSYRVEVQQAVVYVGTDPEFADYDNPRGERYEVQRFLQLTAPDGRRFAGPPVKCATGVKMAAALQRAIDKGFDPATSAAFVEVQPAYGSEAYVAGGWEQINIDAEREAARWEGERFA